MKKESMSRILLAMMVVGVAVALFALAACDRESDQTVVEDRLQEVKDRGKVICASRNDVPGYGHLDASGNNVGFDIDLCRALAAAVLGDPNAIEIRLITAAERGPTIQSGEVDMLVRTVTWTSSRDSQWGNYAQTMFYDGQGFLVNKSLGVSSALDLQGASVCVTQGTTTELNLQDFSNQNSLNMETLTFEDTDAVVAAYQSGQCQAFTNDRSQLAAISSAFDNQDDHVILPETISEEPLGPVVPHGDDQWFDIVKTVMGILIYAEAYGVRLQQRAHLGHRRHQGGPALRPGGLIRPGKPGHQQHRGAGRDSLRGQLRRDIRPQPRPGRHRPAEGERPERAVGRRPLHGLPQGRADLRSTTEVAQRRNKERSRAASTVLAALFHSLLGRKWRRIVREGHPHTPGKGLTPLCTPPSPAT